MTQEFKALKSDSTNHPFAALKFRIANEDQSKRLQEVLFKLGYNWYLIDMEITHSDKPFLYTYSDADILYSGSQERSCSDYFNSHSNQEQDTEEFIKMHTKDVVKPHVHRETIKAWADGAEIQFRSNDQEQWQDCVNGYGDFVEPRWYVDYQYRVKPEPVEVWQWAYKSVGSANATVTNNFYSSEEHFKSRNVSTNVEWIVKLEPTKLLTEE